MAYRDTGSTGSSLFVFILGATVGAAAALLYAPASGTETRAQIVDKANNLRDKASDIGNQAASKATEFKQKIATMTRDTMNKMADTADQVASDSRLGEPMAGMPS